MLVCSAGAPFGDGGAPGTLPFVSLLATPLPAPDCATSRAGAISGRDDALSPSVAIGRPLLSTSEPANPSSAMPIEGAVARPSSPPPLPTAYPRPPSASTTSAAMPNRRTSLLFFMSSSRLRFRTPKQAPMEHKTIISAV
jgi:hypothetical protein